MKRHAKVMISIFGLTLAVVIGSAFRSAPEKWEYMVISDSIENSKPLTDVYGSSECRNAIAKFNALGAEGWELVTSVAHTNERGVCKQVVWSFKRRLP